MDRGLTESSLATADLSFSSEIDSCPDFWATPLTGFCSMCQRLGTPCPLIQMQPRLLPSQSRPIPSVLSEGKVLVPPEAILTRHGCLPLVGEPLTTGSV